ncbi:helix-turn-helix domain-containing protein, partial [Nocardia xishanensis]
QAVDIDGAHRKHGREPEEDRRSLAAFGYGPKMLARILRLQRALAVASAGTPPADTAIAAGYADQAHLARDMRELAGMPLGEWLARRGRDRPSGA